MRSASKAAPSELQMELDQIVKPHPRDSGFWESARSQIFLDAQISHKTLAVIAQGNGDSSLLPLAFVQLAQADKSPPNQE